MQQPHDFHDEGAALAALITPLSKEAFDTPTLFKGWTINTILRHLHVWNIAADLSLSDAAAFEAFLFEMASGIRGGRLPDFEAAYLHGLSGQELCAAWVKQFEAMTTRFAAADPKHRVKWVGPEMSVLSSITARLMETWAHGQAVYDVLGVERTDTDRIGNIVRLGINTYGWTFRNRAEDAPGPMPHLRLTAPSGVLWEFGEPGGADLIAGSATEFCQVICQTRNIADTALSVTGAAASRWMAIAQCFAGPPQTPPSPGARHKVISIHPTLRDGPLRAKRPT
jgi:uncharacterized protein (TIGR03084 family)